MSPSSPERSRQIQDLFDALVDLDPAERATHFEQACPDDPALRREVASLLAAFDERAPAMHGALDKLPLFPLFASDSPTEADPLVGQTAA